MTLKIALELFIPIITANILHMLIVKLDLFPTLKIPISKSFFGKNKTYRGLFVLVLLTASLQLLFNAYLYNNFQVMSFIEGAVLGFIYILCELPNSFFKRRLGLNPGEQGIRYPWMVTIIDKADSTFGVCLFYSIYKGLSINNFILLFGSAFFVHLLVSKFLYAIRIKESL